MTLSHRRLTTQPFILYSTCLSTGLNRPLKILPVTSLMYGLHGLREAVPKKSPKDDIYNKALTIPPKTFVTRTFKLIKANEWVKEGDLHGSRTKNAPCYQKHRGGHNLPRDPHIT